MEKKIFHIEGMSCGGCADRLKKALQQIPGLETVRVDLETGRAEVIGSGDSLQEESIREAVNRLGFSVQGVD